MSNHHTDQLTKYERYRLKDIEAYRKRKREWARTHIQKRKRVEYMRVWRSKNRARYNEMCRKNHKKNYPKRRDILRNYYLVANYGITSEQYDQMLSLQCGVCKICSKPPSRYRLAIDHCHKTGKIRGLLCAHCNGVLGTLEQIGFEKFYGYLVNSDH